MTNLPGTLAMIDSDVPPAERWREKSRKEPRPASRPATGRGGQSLPTSLPGQIPCPDHCALNAIRLITNHLRPAQLRPKDASPRPAMAQGSLEAGMAFTNAILGATQATSHQVGGPLDLPRGVLALLRAAS